MWEASFPELQKQLDEALKKNDPLLDAKLIKEELKLAKVVTDKPVVVGAGAGAGAGVGAIGIGVAGALYFRKRKKQNLAEEKQNST